MHSYVYSTRDFSLSSTCLVSAITNYTTRVVDTTLSATQRQEALKFLGLLTHPVIRFVVFNNFSVCNGRSCQSSPHFQISAHLTLELVHW